MLMCVFFQFILIRLGSSQLIFIHILIICETSQSILCVISLALHRPAIQG